MLLLFLRRMCILLLDGMFCKCLLNPGLTCKLSPVLPYYFSILMIYPLLEQVLKSPTIVLLCFSLQLIFSFVFRSFCVLSIYIYKCYVLLLDGTLYQYILIFFVSYYSVDLKSVSSNITTSVFFWIPFAWNIFSIPSLSICVSLKLK